jgi:hypothetical protein
MSFGAPDGRSGAVAIARSSGHGRVRYFGSEVWGGTWPVALRAQ